MCHLFPLSLLGLGGMILMIPWTGQSFTNSLRLGWGKQDILEHPTYHITTCFITEPSLSHPRDSFLSLPPQFRDFN
jgi:hypothetical protein